MKRNYDPFPRLAFIVLAVFAVKACGQTITLSGQGNAALKALAGRSIPGWQLVGAVACAPSDRPVEFSGGRVYEAAAKAGFRWSGSEVASVNLLKTASLNWRNLAIFIARTGSSALAVAGSGGIVKIGAGAVAGVAMGHQFLDEAVPFMQSRAPDPQGIVQRIFTAEARYSLTPNACIGGYIGAAFDDNAPKKAITIAMDAETPAWFELAMTRKELEANREMLAVMRSNDARSTDTPQMEKALTVPPASAKHTTVAFPEDHHITFERPSDLWAMVAK